MSKFRTLWQNYRWSLLLCTVLLAIVMVSVLTQSVAAEVTANQTFNVSQDTQTEPTFEPEPTTVPPLPTNYWSYSVKWVCDDQINRERNTVINILNPSHTGSLMVMSGVVTVSGAVVVRPPTANGLVGLNPSIMTIPGLGATVIDCNHLGSTPNLREGFVNIASEKPLDIVAVYIRSYIDDQIGEYVLEKNENVEIEHVPGRYVMNGEAQPNGWEQP
jgi:hypothetical protein